MNLIPLIELGRTPPTAFFNSRQVNAGAAQPGEKTGVLSGCLKPFK